MDSMSWRRVALSFCVLAATAMAGAGRAQDATTAPTPRMKQTRAIIARMTGATGVVTMALSPDGKHLASIIWTGMANTLDRRAHV